MCVCGTWNNKWPIIISQHLAFTDLNPVRARVGSFVLIICPVGRWAKIPHNNTCTSADDVLLVGMAEKDAYKRDLFWRLGDSTNARRNPLSRQPALRIRYTVNLQRGFHQSMHYSYSYTVVTCAKFSCDQLNMFLTRALLILIEFRIRSKYR